MTSIPAAAPVQPQAQDEALGRLAEVDAAEVMDLPQAPLPELALSDTFILKLKDQRMSSGGNFALLCDDALAAHAYKTALATEIEHRLALAGELFDLRNRAGCGPEQEGPDVWQQLAAERAAREEAEASRDSYLKYTQPAVLRRAEAAEAELERVWKVLGPTKVVSKDLSELVAEALAAQKQMDGVESHELGKDPGRQGASR